MKTTIYMSLWVLLSLAIIPQGFSQNQKATILQEEFGCADEELSVEEYALYREWVAEERVLDKSILRSPITRYAPVVFHIVRNAAGEGVTVEEVEQLLEWANEKFEEANIQLYQCSPPNIITSNFWYDEVFQYSWDRECGIDTPEYDFDAAFHVPNVINIYCVNTSGSSWAAFPWLRESLCMDWIVYNQFSIRNEWLLAHELGHYFGLLHTFQGHDENTTRSPLNSCFNCLTEGDLLCDTPADHHSTSADWQSGCTPNNTWDDCGMLLMPNGRNLMSYSNSACQADEKFFTNGQNDRMNYNLIENRDYLNCTHDCVQQYSLSGQHNNSRTYRAWDYIQSTADVNPGVSISYQAGDYIRLRPGFHAESGSIFTASIMSCIDDSDNFGGTLVDMRDQESMEEAPASNSVFTAYPSPFTEQLKIEYFAKPDQFVSLALFNTTGQQLIYQEQSISKGEGLQRVILNTINLLPGIYFIVLNTGSKAETIKVVKM